MFSFFKKKKKIHVPPWAGFFTPDQYSRFLEAVDNYFQREGYPYAIEDGILNVGENDAGFSWMGLSSLAQMCRINAPAIYPDVVGNHFEAMKRIHAANQAFNEKLGNYNAISPHLGVRLHDNEYISHIPQAMRMGKPVAEDLYAMIVFDLPDSIRNVKPAEARAWGKSADELFETGLANIRASYGFRIDQTRLKDARIWLIFGDHFYTGNFLFELGNRPELLGREGALVGLPHRHAMLIYPVNDLSAMTVAYDMIHVISGMYNEGPGSLSSQLYWYRGGDIVHLPYRVDGNDITLSPPFPFVETLGRLG